MRGRPFYVTQHLDDIIYPWMTLYTEYRKVPKQSQKLCRLKPYKGPIECD